METTAEVEPVSFSDVLDLATWNRPRGLSELRSFVESHHDDRLDDIDLDI